MLKKVSIIFIFLLSIYLPFFIPEKEVSAAAPVARVVAGSVGERVIIGLAEKAGYKYTSKQAREIAVDRWNMELYKRIEEANNLGKTFEAEELARFQRSLVDIEPTTIKPNPSKPGFGKIALNTAMFLTGADIVVDLFNAVNESIEFNKTLDVMDSVSREIASGERYNGLTGMHWHHITSGGDYMAIYTHVGVSDPPWHPSTAWQYAPIINPTITFSSYKITGSRLDLYDVVIFFTVDGNLKTRKYTSTWAQTVPNYTPVEYSQVKPTDLSNPYIEPLTWRDRITDIEEVPIINPEVIPDNFPTEIEIEIPMEVPTPQQWEEPWNDPLTDEELEPVTDPGTDPGQNPLDDLGIQPAPESIPGLEPNPIDGGGTGTPDPDGPKSNPDDTVNRWAGLVTNKFPFSLPWDIYSVIDALVASPERPEIDIDKSYSIAGIEVPIKFSHDFKWMDSFIGFVRVFILISFVIYLIIVTGKLLGGAK